MLKKFFVIRDLSTGKYLFKEDGLNYVTWTSFSLDSNRFDSVKEAEKFIEGLVKITVTGYFEIVPVITNKAK